MNEELLKIYKERLRTYDRSLVPEEAAGYFSDLAGALSGAEPVKKERFMFPEAGTLPEEIVSVLWVWYYEALRDYPQTEEALLRILETSIRLLCAFEEAYAEMKTLPEEKVLRDIVWSYLHDYAGEFTKEWILDGIGAERLFISGDPLWGPLSGRTGTKAVHAADMALFWGDRLKAGKLSALENVWKERNSEKNAEKALPETYAVTEPEGSVFRFTERQDHLWKEYALRAETILHEKD